MDRGAFLTRVRDAARAGRQHRVPTRDVPPNVGYVGGGDDLSARLAAEIDGVGGKAWLVDDANAGRGRLVELVASKQPATALCWEHPLLDAIGVRGVLQAAGAAAISHANLASLAPDAQRSAILAADLGIAAADWAVAETGSLVVGSRPGQERFVSLLPPILVSVVDAGRIVPDLFDLFQQLHSREETVKDGARSSAAPPAPIELPSNLAFITGPSKTGDIELQLTTGVHGPGEWHVIIIRQLLP
jgi:L-lactate utilization protein LutC